MSDISKLKVEDISYTIKDSVARDGLAEKQDILISGTTIKTINGATILGSGNIEIGSGGTISYETIVNALGYVPADEADIQSTSQPISGSNLLFTSNGAYLLEQEFLEQIGNINAVLDRINGEVI